MRAVLFDQPGDESVLRIGDAPKPSLSRSAIRIQVHATAINRADLLQRQGHYPPPPGASEILGMECAGEVAEVADGVVGWNVGDRAMALLAGGGYAEEVVVDARSAMKIPAGMSFQEAAAIPEVFLTSFLNLFMIGGASSEKRLLVHGGSSGVGTASILLCRNAGIPIAVTVGSDEKVKRCLDLGAALAINYRTEDFVKRVSDWTGGKGVDLVLDHMGAVYLERNIASIGLEGHLVMIGTMGGSSAELNIGALLSKRIRITASTLRGRSVEKKGEIVSEFLKRFGPALADGSIKPVIDRVFPWTEVAAAHRAMAADHFGKIVLDLE